MSSYLMVLRTVQRVANQQSLHYEADKPGNARTAQFDMQMREEEKRRKKRAKRTTYIDQSGEVETLGE